mgnify:CR=1 FL=1
MFAAPDDKALYFELFRASEQAARLWWEAQQKAEQEALRADPPPLELEPLRHRSRDATSPKVGGTGESVLALLTAWVRPAIKMWALPLRQAAAFRSSGAQ